MPDKKMLIIGIAGTKTDFLLAPHTLKCFLYQDIGIKDNLEIVLKQYYYIDSDQIEEKSKNIINDIEEINPDFIGFSCYVWNIETFKHVSEKLKEKNINAKIILGGPEIARDDITAGKFNNFNADYFIFGEGEKPLLTLLKNLLGLVSDSLENTKGLAYRKEGSVFCSNELDFIKELDKVPSPYLNGFVSDEILTKPDMRVNVESQRGCSFRCAYCFYHKGFPTIRYRDPDVVVDEIDYAYKKGIRTGRIVDANFISDREFAKKIMRGIIERRIKMSIFFEILPPFLDDELAELFGQFRELSPENRIMIGIGIQTLNQESLAVIKRQISKSWFEKAFEMLRKEGTIIKSDIILGLPRETKDTYLKTLEFITEKMRHGTNYLSLSLLRILPGTDLVEIAEKENMTLDKRDDLHFIYETSTFPRSDMIHCLRLNTVAFRLLSSIDITSRMKLRDLYFDVKDSLNVTNVEILEHFVKRFYEYLKDKNSNFVNPDFPNAEYYSHKTVYNEIPDEWLIEELKQLKEAGLPKTKN